MRHIFTHNSNPYIHLFQKTLSETTANGSCRTEIARPKGTVVSLFGMQKQWRVLAPTTSTTTSTSLARSRSCTRSRKNKVKHTLTTRNKIVNQSRLNLRSPLMATCKIGEFKYSLHMNEFRSEVGFPTFYCLFVFFFLCE